MKSKNEQKTVVTKPEEEDKKVIKMKVKRSKKFETKPKEKKIKVAEKGFEGGSKKKRRRKMKREKLQKMLKGGGSIPNVVTMKVRNPSEQVRNLRKSKVE